MFKEISKRYIEKIKSMPTYGFKKINDFSTSGYSTSSSYKYYNFNINSVYWIKHDYMGSINSISKEIKIYFICG